MPAISFGKLPTYVMLLPINKSFFGYFATGAVSSPAFVCVAHVELLSSGLTSQIHFHHSPWESEACLRIQLIPPKERRS